MTLLALCSCLAGCKPYKVLAGELSLDNGGLDYSIDKAKVEIALKEDSRVKIPLVIKNNSDEEIEFNITSRMPDFTATGYSPLGIKIPIAIVFNMQNIIIQGDKSGKIDIEVIRNSGEAQPVEIWVSVKDDSKAMIHKELVSRIFVNVKN
jgi:hypothetical protein